MLRLWHTLVFRGGVCGSECPCPPLLISKRHSMNPGRATESAPVHTAKSTAKGEVGEAMTSLVNDGTSRFCI